MNLTISSKLQVIRAFYRLAALARHSHKMRAPSMALSALRRLCSRRPCGRKEILDKFDRSCYCKSLELSMNTVTVSSKFQVVIPKEIRDGIGLQVGTLMEIITYGSRIELVPIQPMKSLKGIFKGINTEITREEDRI